MLTVVAAVFGWILLSALVGGVAASMDRNGPIFLATAMVVSPLVALIVLAIIGTPEVEGGRSTVSPSTQSVTPMGLIVSGAVGVIFVLLGGMIATNLPTVPQFAGFLGGLVPGAVFAWGVTWVLPERMLTRA